jgi:hypothetical protein
MTGDVSMSNQQTARFPPPTFPYRWRTRRIEAVRYGTLCRKVYEATEWGYGAQGGTITVEFEDGHRATAYRGEVRRVPAGRTGR